MKTFEESLKINRYQSKAFDMYFGGKNIAVFDIETTGLFPLHDKIILTGILLISKSGCRMIQYFSDKTDDEAELIQNTLTALKEADVVITYNGRSFDIPFLNKRASKHGLPDELSAYDFDLYTVVSGYSDLNKVLDSLSQKSIEMYMGISDTRDDEINGYESVRLYEQYMSSHSFSLENKILLHNHDDVMQLYNIMPIINYVDLHKAMFNLGFPAGKFIVTRSKLNSGSLTIHAVMSSPSLDYISFPTDEKPYSLMISTPTGDVELNIPVEKIHDDLIIDAQRLLNDDDALLAMSNYPSFESGYLIIRNDNGINYMEINAFLISFLTLLSRSI